MLKRYSLLLWFCLLPFSVFTQIAIEVEGTNSLVEGIDNPMHVVVSDLPDSCLLFKPSSGIIQKTQARSYVWSSVDSAQVSLILIDSCSGDTVAKRHFRVIDIPVSIRLGNHYSGPKALIRVAEFKAQLGVVATMHSMDICGNCAMLGFYVDFYDSSTKELWTGYNFGARFSGEIAERQQQIKAGDKVVFRQFKYLCTKRIRYSNEVLSYEIK